MNQESVDMTTNPSLLLRLRDLQDRRAWGTFVEVYGPLIFSYCRRKKLQDSDAADVSQEVLTRVSKAIASFEYQPDRGRFRDWLGKVTHRELLQFWKRTARSKHVQSTDERSPVDNVEDTKDWAEHFHAELLQLALGRIQNEFEQTTWSAFQKLWIDDLAPNEVAAALGISLGSLYVSKSRVLKRLKAEVLMLSHDLPLIERFEIITDAEHRY